MRILMVSPYPPIRDGIAAYAVQAVQALREQGHEVEVLSPGPSAAHHHLDLVGPRGALALAKRVRAYDKIIVQFHPDFFYPYPNTPAQRMAESMALTTAFTLANEVEVVVHEIDIRHGRRGTPDGMAARRLWRSVDRIFVHTEQERTDFAKGFGVPLGRISVVDHGAHFTPNTRFDRAGARRTLGIADDAYVFLAIGFIQPHKGFDRAVRAFRGLAPRGARLDIVGSLRTDEPDYVAYAEELGDLCAITDGAQLHQGYVSDELFDRWIVAADTVVLPYRQIWSSGVLERAALYGRPVIATAVGGLAGQAGDRGDITLVHDDAELGEAMRRAIGVHAWTDATEVSQPWPDGGDDLRVRVQDEVRSRAAYARGSRAVTRTDTPTDRRVVTVPDPGAAVRRLPRLQPPAAGDGPRGRRLVKRVVRRLTAWEVEPLYHQITALQNATTRYVEASTTCPPPATPAGTANEPAAGASSAPDRARRPKPYPQAD